MRRKYPIQLIPVTYSNTDTTETTTLGTPREVLADRKSIRQSEFYQAAMNGFKPQVTWIIWQADYLNEDRLIYNGITYEIIRRFPDPDDIHIELTCQILNDINQDLTPLQNGF